MVLVAQNEYHSGTLYMLIFYFGMNPSHMQQNWHFDSIFGKTFKSNQHIEDDIDMVKAEMRPLLFSVMPWQKLFQYFVQAGNAQHNQYLILTWPTKSNKSFINFFSAKVCCSTKDVLNLLHHILTKKCSFALTHLSAYWSRISWSYHIVNHKSHKSSTDT